MMKEEGEAQAKQVLHVVLNWTEEVKAAFPRAGTEPKRLTTLETRGNALQCITMGFQETHPCRTR